MAEAASIVSLYCIFGSAEEAERIGRQVVEERLAACVNILGPCHSIYRWRDVIEDSQEVPALFKTAARNADRLVNRLADLHSYEVPAIAVWPVERTLPAYGEWVVESTG